VNYLDRLNRAVPGGCHTYSKGSDQFPDSAPEILKCGKGCEVFDSEENRLIDYGMGLRSVIIGYANREVCEAAFEGSMLGNNLTKPSIVELEAAEKMIDLIPSAEMVKFAKNGSNVTTAAIKVARAYTGKKYVARCRQHPFFSFDDWFIGTTPLKKGVPEEHASLTIMFDYGDISSLEMLFEEKDIACVIMEPTTGQDPRKNIDGTESKCFLKEVRQLCDKKNSLMILDEMITGFRYDLKGAGSYFNVDPDMSTFGKAMANGFSVAALTGKKEIMSVGSTDTPGSERTFLLSSTHGAEISSLTAFLKTVEIMEREKVISSIWKTGREIMDFANSEAESLDIKKIFNFSGFACSPNFSTTNESGDSDLFLRTFFQEKMLENGIMMPYAAISHAHREEQILAKTKTGLRNTLREIKIVLESGTGFDKALRGNSIKPVFRKFN
jgi:glutamate-1-semialdehyde 2,1-aminomutase